MLEFLASGKFFEVTGYTLSLSIARVTPLVYIFPLLSRLELQAGFLRTAILIALAGPVFPAVFIQLNEVGSPGPLLAIGLIMKEFVIGMIIAVILSIPFWSADIAGKCVEAMIGMNAATSEAEISGSIGDLFLVFLAIIFLSTDFFHVLILGTYYKSYEIWPPLAPFPGLFDTALFDTIGILDKIMLTGFLLALPFISIFLLLDLLSGFMLKFTNAINPQFLMMSFKPFFFILLLPPFASAAMMASEQGIAELLTTLPAVEMILAPQGGSSRDG